MLLVFLQERDRRFSMITALVLAVIIIGAVLGALSSRAMRG
jgi:predicted nucleic acid-binding Zn ribbon protein